MAYSVGVNRIGKDAYRLTYPGASAAYTALGDEVIFMNEKNPPLILPLTSIPYIKQEKSFLF
jgi:hypothetical protein